MKIGILTSGGDCPGINATIRGVGRTAILHYNMEVVGIRKGFSGLLENDYTIMDEVALSGLLYKGGTILGTSREKPFRKRLFSDEDLPRKLKQHYDDLGLDCLVAIGGNGTMKTAAKMRALGINVVGIPKTIDNDIWGTEVTFGFDTAVATATECIDRLHTTAESHRRVMVVEVMGHKAGWIALHSGMAGGAHVILIPELGYNPDKVIEAINKRMNKGKLHSIVVVAEGVKSLGGEKERPAFYLSKYIEEHSDLVCRETVLGHIQRGGSPTAADRNLATLLGGYATELVSNRIFGVMVAVVNGQMTHLPLEEVAGKLKMVREDNPLVIQGKKLGISFGTED